MNEKRVKIDGEEYKKYLLDAMVYLDRICRENGITYFLFYGTLLGAVRHGGFIPWDDDVDIIMPRQEYFKLIECIKADKSKYKVMSIHTVPDYYAPLAKLVDTSTRLIQHYGYKKEKDLGVYIDIFILDGLPSGENAVMAYKKRAVRLTKFWEVSGRQIIRSRKTICKDVLRFLYYLPCHIKGYRYYLQEIDRFASKYEYGNSEWISNLSYTSFVGECYYKEDLIPVDHEFEGHMFIIPKGYGNILEMVYGDWRKLPPIEERIGHHDYECYKVSDL